jgi:hypothetical protein
MGGPGSGLWYRWNKRTTLDEVKRLDVRWLHRQGYLQPWVHTTVTWTSRERPAGSISVAMQDGCFIVEYRYRTHGTEDWEPVRQIIALDWTRCTYGGTRPWFCCPGCQRRVAILCGAGKWFLCRSCYQMPYTSQVEIPLDRLHRKFRKIRDRLGAHYTRPKGMHRRTWERLQEQAIEAEMAWDLAWDAALMRLMLH